jgi:hypothetical protein
MSKYGNRKVTRNGITYDSVKEANRHAVLKLLERSGKISDLQRQVKFELLPAQRNEAGKLLERAVSYVADFTYMENGKLVVEDSKGFRTPEYKLKKKMLLYFTGHHIKET